MSNISQVDFFSDQMFESNILLSKVLMSKNFVLRYFLFDRMVDYFSRIFFLSNICSQGFFSFIKYVLLLFEYFSGWKFSAKYCCVDFFLFYSKILKNARSWLDTAKLKKKRKKKFNKLCLIKLPWSCFFVEIKNFHWN